jgi:hypothetical protein
MIAKTMTPMKRPLVTLALCTGLFTIGTLKAQTTQLSIGADAMLPIGDFSEWASFGVGPALGVEFPAGDRAAFVLQFAYNFLTPQDDAGIDSWTMMPIQAGGKFFFQETQKGAYGSLLLGLHNQTVTTKEIDGGPLVGTIPSVKESEADFSWAVGAGYQMEKLDIGARYNAISDSNAKWGYFGFRVAYLIGLGK